MKRLILLCIVTPLMVSAQVFRYASPTGSANNAGSKSSPWNITRALSACSSDTTIILRDGVYLQDSTASWNPGTGVGRSRMIADAGARPVFARTNGQAPSMHPANNTTLQGIWFGGLPVRDSLGMALGHGSCRAPAQGDSLIGCVTFNTWDDGWGSDKYRVVIKNCLFVNCGINANQLSHAMYLTGRGKGPDSTILVDRCVVIASDKSLIHAAQGWSIHFWHNPTGARIRKNFTSYRAVHQGKDVTCRDNVFWGGNMMFTTQEGIVHDSAAIDTPHIWRHNIAVKRDYKVPFEKAYFTWPDPVSERGNAAYPEVMWWDGDSTAMNVDQFQELGQGYVRSFGVTKHPKGFNTNNLPVLIGADSATVDAAIAKLTTVFYDQNAQQVHDNATINANWQVLLDVVDTWQGTREDPVTIFTSVPTGEYTAAKEYSLFQNYPNPFNPSTTIRFELFRMSRVSLKIFDILGREVAALVDGEKPAGVHEVIFDARGYASGVYFCQLRVGSFSSTKTMVLMK